MRRTGHRFQGEAVEKTALPPFEPPGRYLEQRKEALNLGGLSESQKRRKYLIINHYKILKI